MGKSTLIRSRFSQDSVFWIDLLNIEEEQKYLKHPDQLFADVKGLDDSVQTVVIDEVQKIPALLDVVHRLMNSSDKQVVLTGSSARKLRHGHANLLAGRAFLRELYPFSYQELGDTFSLNQALQFGMLPKVWSLNTAEEKADYLRAYAHIYLKEEVWAEHLIRRLQPFQYFLQVAAQCNGDILNYSKLASDTGVDAKTIAEYYSILDDTLLGFHLPPFRHSFRKRLSKKMKFYFFDLGLVNALSRTLSIPAQPGHYGYGRAFEHFVILEALKLARQTRPDFRFTHLRTHDGLEVDLVVERPELPLLMIEIKSAHSVQSRHLRHLKQIQIDMTEAVECICLAQIDRPMILDDIKVLPWDQGLACYLSG